jgi:hypothetical protein
MGTPAPATTPEERSSNLAADRLWRGAGSRRGRDRPLLLRTDSKIANAPPAYAASLKFSDMKMSAGGEFSWEPPLLP